jgi:hypothetical protein
MRWRRTDGLRRRMFGTFPFLLFLLSLEADSSLTDSYLLSPQTSLSGGLGAPGSRIVLLGSDPLSGEGNIDLESVKLTELVEFAVSLIPTVKGQEPFAGFPHLQAFRLYHGSVLADQGNVAQASKCVFFPSFPFSLRC